MGGARGYVSGRKIARGVCYCFPSSGEVISIVPLRQMSYVVMPSGAAVGGREAGGGSDHQGVRVRVGGGLVHVGKVRVRAVPRRRSAWIRRHR
jgi:hypothetical protein